MFRVHTLFIVSTFYLFLILPSSFPSTIYMYAVFVYVYTYMYIYVTMYECAYLCFHVHMYRYIHLYIYTYVYIRTVRYKKKCTYKYTHVHMYLWQKCTNTYFYFDVCTLSKYTLVHMSIHAPILSSCAHYVCPECLCY